MKLEECNPKDLSGIPQLRLKFFANTTYPAVFNDSNKSVIEAFNGKYIGCYGCGRCKDGLEGLSH